MTQTIYLDAIKSGDISLGIELGSTRIKAVLIGPDYQPIATGTFGWENRVVDGVWSYDLEDVWTGLRSAYSELSQCVKDTYGISLKRVKSFGVSGMMHGYLAFSKDDEQLVPFRTWRNTITERAARKLTDLMDFNIPQRWSVAHLYEAMLNGESHVAKVAYLTTLSGYVHWKLTGNKVLGVGDASGMFPIDSETNTFDEAMVAKFDNLLEGYPYHWKLEEILPKVLVSGDDAGFLTEEGARLLDPTGDLEAGIPMCAPEGDAGTGMVATNSVAVRTGNVSAGTSIFAMSVLEKPLSKVYIEIDMVTTPAGDPVAMVHCNTGTSELDAWVDLFEETLGIFGSKPDKAEIYGKLYNEALKGDADAGGIVSFNYFSGEPITDVEDGRPLMVRHPETPLTLGNLMRSHLYSSIATLKIGMDILTDDEKVALDVLMGHGGLFKTKGVAQSFLASALDVPVCVMETAGEGGPWGMAILSAYLTDRNEGESLESFLADRVFLGGDSSVMKPVLADRRGFLEFLETYRSCVEVEKAAVQCLK